MPKLRHRTAHTDTDRARCRMCGTTVAVGTDGCCPLGHPADIPTPRPVAVGPAEAGPVEAGPVDAEPVEAGPVEAGPVEAGPVEAGPVDAEPVEAGPVEAEPVEAGPVEAGPVEGPPAAATPTEARPAEDAPVDEVAPATIPAESTPADEPTPADEDAGAAARLDWLDWDAEFGHPAPPSTPAGLPSPVAKLPPPPAPAAPQLSAADRMAERDDGRAALDALLAAHHQRVPPSALDVRIEQLRLPGPPAPLAVSPAIDAHGDDDTHADARAFAELLRAAETDEGAEERPGRSRRLAVRLAGAVMLLLFTAAMTAAVVVAL